jgi:hypothetical protein
MLSIYVDRILEDNHHARFAVVQIEALLRRRRGSLTSASPWAQRCELGAYKMQCDKMRTHLDREKTVIRISEESIVS